MSTRHCNVVVIGAGPYGLAAAAYLQSAGIETRVFGDPMSFWERQMPAGMFLRSNLRASHIADPKQELTLEAYSRQNGGHIGKPIPLDLFVKYGHWYQKKAVPNVERRTVTKVEAVADGFQLILENGQFCTCSRVVVATGIGAFASRPEVFQGITNELASHSSEHNDLRKFKAQRVVVVGAGQSALESAALLQEIGADVEVIGRRDYLNWVGLHPKLHRLGLVSAMLYSKRDVGPAGISRVVAMPHVFRKFPRVIQDRTAYRAIRPAVAGWLKPRLENVPITLGKHIVSATTMGNKLKMKLNDGAERNVDHALLATGFRVDVSKYPFLSGSILESIKTAKGYPILKRGLESSIAGLHFIGKPAAWSFGPLLGFVSGAEFAATELLRSIAPQY